MGDPHIQVLGVYKLSVTDDLFREQYDNLYGDYLTGDDRAQAEEQLREQLSSIVLVEVLVINRDETFDVGQFTQPQDGVQESNWQVAWAEAYLTTDGEALSVKRWSNPSQSGDLRVAFFLHFWQSEKPLRSSYGEVICSAVQQMPERLARLVPYEPVD